MLVMNHHSFFFIFTNVNGTKASHVKTNTHPVFEGLYDLMERIA